MAFSSLSFLILYLPVMMVLYFTLPVRFRTILLLFANICFFSWGDPLSLLFIFILMSLTILFGELILFFQAHYLPGWIPLSISVIMNGCFIWLFEYGGLSIMLLQVGLHRQSMIMTPLHLLGISIYMMHSISYLVAIYRGKILFPKNVLETAVYLTFFPIMIAGPLIRYEDFISTLHHAHCNQYTISKGFFLFLQGLAKKIFLADTMMFLWNDISTIPPGDLTVSTAWLGLISYGFFIYFYLCSYGDMARGLAKMFGLSLPQNFKHPFLSNNLFDFLCRWQLSISSFIKTYLFVFFRKKSSLQTHPILKVIILCIGLGAWHGSKLGFWLWGSYLAVLVIVEQLFLISALKRLPVVFQKIYFWLFITIGWVFFSQSTLSQSLSYMQSMFGIRSFSSSTTTPTSFLYQFIDPGTLYLLKQYGFYLFICMLLSFNVFPPYLHRIEAYKPALAMTLQTIVQILLLCFCFAAVVGSTQHHALITL